MGWGMQQLTLATAGFERYAKTTRRAAFLAVRADRTVLSEAGQRPPAGRGRADAADLFLAAMVQPVGPGSGGGALRFADDAAFCRDRSRPRAGARRDHGVPLPPPAGGAR